MSDGDFWFDQFRSMVNIVNNLRHEKRDLEDELIQLKKNTPKIEYDTLSIIKKIRDFHKEKVYVAYGDDGNPDIVQPNLIDTRNMVEKILNQHVRITVSS